MTEEWTLNLPDDVSRELEKMDEDRVSQVVSDALREALNLAESAEERRDELRKSMGIASWDSEELAEDSTEAFQSDVEAKQAELRDKITGAR
ncbi:hypothetical protein U4E84_02720 [Halorubrum sp. AD140]|uniref:hypothetical protein n=1 Tax=Halorubrum sp. AD140 TaxID=3050073 RepID=UPI002ACCC786|nr:hypothetical protein [Halorubrum sp. AD140]MDZ5810269.1 hypothetical protein [Halorubrum sp. AD140]